MAEKCFCHLNGYKVKDVDAREMTTALQTQLDTEVENLNGRLDIQAEHIADILATQTTQGKKIETLEQGIPDLIARSQLIELQERVTDIEENGTGGGSKLYSHKIQIYEDNNDSVDLIFSFISSDATPVDSETKLLSILKTRGPFLCSGSFLNYDGLDETCLNFALSINAYDWEDFYSIKGIAENISVNTLAFSMITSGDFRNFEDTKDWQITYTDTVTEV